MTVKRNSQGNLVVRLHYSADPEKNPATPEGKAWYDRAVKLYHGGANSLGWRREMEIDWSAGVGELVFPYFTEKEPLILCDPTMFNAQFLDRCRLYGGMDWGRRNPYSFHVYAEDPDGFFYSIYEIYGTNKPYALVAEQIRNCPYYDRLENIAADPSMWNNNQDRKDGFTSTARMFYEELPEGSRIDKLMRAHGRSDMLMVEKLHAYWNAPNPKFKISKMCPRQISEFKNLKFAPNVYDKNEPEKLLDKDNHATDDFKYFVLSHPSAKQTEEKPKFGTISYYNQCVEAASEVAAESGMDFQEAFNEIYGAL